MLGKLKSLIKKCPPLYKVAFKVYHIFVEDTGRATFNHTYNVSEILLNQNREGGYIRLDTYVRLLAIENEYGLNDFGWEYYKKMQKARKHSSDEDAERRVEIFKKLMKSYEENGYDEKSEIQLCYDLKLRDGGHRTALALYHGLKTMNCHVLATEYKNADYGLEWFIENDFTCEEIQNILNKAHEVIGKNKIRMSCLLWSPVEEYFDEITEKINLMHKVVSYEDLTFSSEETYPRFVRTVYKSDDIADWKVEKKLEHMAQPGDKKVRYIVVEVDNPSYRYKGKNGNLILIQAERLKKIIRNCYAGKVENYFHDIIMHTSDNLDQMEYIDRLVHPTFSVADYFEEIKDLEWVIVRHDAEYIPDDFPKTFPFGQDVDMLTTAECFDRLMETTEKFFRQKCEGAYDDLIMRNKSNGCRSARIELKGNLIYMVDVATVLDGMDADYCRSIVKNRVKRDTYWVPALEDEICVRANEYITHPKKIRHLEYVKNHLDGMNKEKLLKYVANSDEFLKLLEEKGNS